MQMLAVAQRVLGSDPERALRLAEQGEREFPRTMFSAERKQLALLAMVKLGRVEEARRIGQPIRDGPAAAALFTGVSGLAVSSSGDIVVADSFNNRLRKIFKNAADVWTIKKAAGLGALIKPDSPPLSPSPPWLSCSA